MSILVVKLGSSTLVAPDGQLRDEVLRARVADLARARQAGVRPVLVSSGAVASGLGRLGFRSRPTALADLQAASAVGQGVLFQRYAELFGGHDTVAAQVLLTSADVAARSSYLNARRALMRLLQLGAVPIINENDTTATDELTFGDNDVLAAQVALLLGARWLALLTEREGLFGTGPGGEPRLLAEVHAEQSPHRIPLATMAASGLGRGGIATKVAAAAMARGGGVTCVIASGAAAGVIPAVVAGRPVGTRFAPADRRESAFKLWLRHARPTAGRVVVDAGAARALRERGTSLLAVGVVGRSGDFQPGDAVEVVSASGSQSIGKGITRLSAADLDAVAGLHSDRVRERLPEAPVQVIHRDEFVLFAGAEETTRHST